MSEPIKVGDLVMVVRWGGCCNGRIGQIFQVARTGSWDLHGKCSLCGANSIITESFEYAEAANATQRAPFQWLKRIPPMSQLEHFRTEELLRRDVKEPA